MNADHIVDSNLAVADASQEHNPTHADDDAVSETSTVAYEHEPFETYQHKVAELIAEKFDCDRTLIRTERIKGGGYNRVLGLEILAAAPKRNSWLTWLHKLLRTVLGKPESQAYVVRIPRGYNETDRQIATLEIVNARLPFPTPQVMKHDLTHDNVLENPYTVQKRITGQRVDQMLGAKALNLAQKKALMRQVIEIANHITSIEAAPGNISADNLASSKDGPLRVDRISADLDAKDPSAITKSLDHLLEVIEMRRKSQIENGLCYYDIWNGFEIICKSLETRGFLTGPSVLVHGDLEPRNLLAQITGPSTVNITGVIDWDDAHFAPKVMALRSPFWLWVADQDDDYEDLLEQPALVEPSNEEGRLLWHMFMESASEEHKRYGLSPEAVLARRMYHHLRNGLHSEWEAVTAESIICEWDEIHPEDHAKIGEGYFTAEGEYKEGAWEVCANWQDSGSESEEESEDEDEDADKGENVEGKMSP